MRHPRSLLPTGCALVMLLVTGATPAFAAAPPPSASASTSVETAAGISAGPRMVEFPAGGDNPADVVAGPDGSVWVALFIDKKVVRLDRSGRVVDSVSLPGGPSSLATDNEGGVWATEIASNAIDHVYLGGAGATSARYVIPTPATFPSRIHDSGQYVFFTESAVGQLGRLDQASGTIAEFTSVASPEAIDGIDDSVWVSDADGDIQIVDFDGVLRATVPLTRVRGFHLLGSTGGVVEGVAYWDDREVRFSWSTELKPVTLVSTRTVISGVAQIGATSFFADSGANVIGTAASPKRYQVPSASSGLSGMAVTEGRFLWCAERNTGKIVRFDTTVVDVNRIDGADRYELAANISRELGPVSLTGEVFVASGEKFADALSAAAVAALASIPLLLSRQADLPEATRQELIQRTPTRVTIIGGPASVSPDVLASISAAVPHAEIRRIGGADRYAVSRALLTRVNGPRSTLYVANGRDFPDALSSTAAAAGLTTGVLLVDGAATQLSPEEMAVIGRIVGPSGTVRIAGGPLSVSAAIEAQIATVAPVIRLGGADRYEVSRAIVSDGAFGASAEGSPVYLASGSVFADALAGGALAGSFKMPLLLTHPDCVPMATLDQIASFEGAPVTLLGGRLTLTAGVESLTACS